MWRWDETVAGFTAGVVGTTFGHPLDTIKVRLQTHAHYTGAFQCAKSIWKHEGWRSFYSGMGAPLVSLTLLNTISFAVYGQCKRLIADTIVAPTSAGSPSAYESTRAVMGGAGSGGPLWQSVLAGGLTGSLIGVFSTPFDMVKVQAQLAGAVVPANSKHSASAAAAAAAGASTASASKSGSATPPPPVAVRKRAGSYVTARRLTQTYGYGVLYRGFAVNSVREFLFGSVYWGGYETAKSTLTREFTGLTRDMTAVRSSLTPLAVSCLLRLAIAGGPSPVASTLAIVMAGSVSGMSGWAISFPLDIIKTNLQGAADLNMRTTAWQSARTQVITFGWSGLYRGLVPTLARASIVSAVRFSAYEAALTAYDTVFRPPNDRPRTAKTTPAVIASTATAASTPKTS